MALYLTTVFFPQNEFMLLVSAFFLFIGHIGQFILVLKVEKELLFFSFNLILRSACHCCFRTLFCNRLQNGPKLLRLPD